MTHKMTGKVQTILGPIDPNDLGTTLTHEHLLMDTSSFDLIPQEASKRAKYYTGSFRWGLFDIDGAIEEVNLYKQYGGESLVECTPIDLYRDPIGLSRISRATGVNIIMGTSYYVGHSHPDDMDSKTEDSIVDEFVRDLNEEVYVSKWDFKASSPKLIPVPTGVKAGIIGEVGCSWPLSDNELKVLRASGRAQRITGAPLLIHPGRDENAPLEILDILSSVGADLEHVIMGHLDRTVFQKQILEQIASSGCYIEWDLFGQEQSYYDSTIDMPSDAQRMVDISWIRSRGYGKKVLVSHDIASERRWDRNGGCGYHHILSNVVPRMREHGYSEEAINDILVENPKNALVFA